jgi:diguanylate cyclase (GGDEF)-like protein
MNDHSSWTQTRSLVAPVHRPPGVARGLQRWSVRVKLMTMAIVASGLILVVLLVALYAFSTAASAEGLALRLATIADVSTGLDAGRHAAAAAANEALLSGRTADAVTEMRDMTAETRAKEAEVRPAGLPAGVLQALIQQEAGVNTFFDNAARVLALATTDRRQALHEVGELEDLNTQLEDSQNHLDAAVDEATADATHRAHQIRDRARRLMLGTAFCAVLALFTFCYAMGRFIVRSLRRLAVAATAIAAGDLDTRCAVAPGDEIGAVGQALDAMADNIQGLLSEMGEEARRDLFKSQLVEAFELTDNEQEAHHQIAVTMTHIAQDLPMELLLSDSSKAHLSRAVVHPLAGGPGCGVETPYSCLAVRRSRVVITESSNDLSACPKLRGREGGACSAVCLPVTFMGRALGVVHVTGPDGTPPDTHQITRLTALAGQTGSVIGTIRATQVTQLQAMTDGLTGLINRRTLENELRDLLESGRPFCLAMADVDHFKKVNDTFGHDAGDRALRLLAETFRNSLRAQDLVGRYGGEEFVLVFPDLSLTDTESALDALRTQLAESQQGASVPTFTVSYGVTDSSAGTTLEQILRCADSALSTAKRDGRDRIVVAKDRRSHPRAQLPAQRSTVDEPPDRH